MYATNLGVSLHRRSVNGRIRPDWYLSLLRALSDAWDAEHARLLREDPYRGDEDAHRDLYRVQAHRVQQAYTLHQTRTCDRRRRAW